MLHPLASVCMMDPGDPPWCTAPPEPHTLSAWQQQSERLGAYWQPLRKRTPLQGRCPGPTPEKRKATSGDRPGNLDCSSLSRQVCLRACPGVYTWESRPERPSLNYVDQNSNKNAHTELYSQEEGLYLNAPTHPISEECLSQGHTNHRGYRQHMSWGHRHVAALRLSLSSGVQRPP